MILNDSLLTAVQPFLLYTGPSQALSRGLPGPSLDYLQRIHASPAYHSATRRPCMCQTRS